MIRERRVCPECCELGLRTFPLAPKYRAAVAGIIRFFAVLKEDSQTEQKCDQCGQVRPVVFTYPALDLDADPDECVHCGHHRLDPIHDEGEGAGRHDFFPKEKPAS